MRRWSLRWGAAVLAVAGLALGGCAEKQEASDSLPSATAEPTEEALPPLGPADLPMPDEARTQDAAGAEAFVRYYIELINRTSDVMDAEPLRAFSDGCEDCDRIATNVEQDAAAGYRYQGGTITLTALGQPLLTDEIAELALGADLAELSVVDMEGNPITNEGAPAYAGLTGGAALSWNTESQAWLMTGLTLS